MKDQLFFSASCPMCRKYGAFPVLITSTETESFMRSHFHHDEWNDYDFNLFSIASKCAHCKNIVSASVAAICDYEKNSKASLSEYADENAELKTDIKLIINFDVPVLLPPHESSSPNTIEIADLYEQAKKCFQLHAWDAVGVLCRKIIDIESTHMWRLRHPNQKPPRTLAKRVEKLLVEDVKKNHGIGSQELRDHLDFNNMDHRLFYDMDIIRENGNEAAHSILAFYDDEAEAMLVFTQSFLSLSAEWSMLNREANEHV